MKIARPAFPSAVVACALVALGLEACGGNDPAPPPAANPSASKGPASALEKPAAPQGAKPGAKAKEGKESKDGEGKADAKGSKGAASGLLAYRTALQFLLKGDPDKALGEFEKAVQLDPQLSEAFFELGKLQVHLSSQNIGSQARDLDLLDKGLASLEKACELAPENDHYQFWVGKTHYLRNDPEKARTSLEKAVEINAQNFLAWKMLGRVQKDSAQMEAARTSFQKALEITPDAGVYFQLGQTLEALDNLPGARGAYEKAISLDPTEPDIFGRLTHVCARLGDADCEARTRAAMESWTEYDTKLKRRKYAVNQHPDDAAALRRLGEMYFEVHNWEQAVEWFVRSIHIDPKDDRTHFLCGIARRNLKDYVEATNHLKEAEFLAPDNLDPKLELLRLYAETKDEASSKELVSTVEGAATADGASLWALAEVCQELGRSEDAARLFGEAKALGVTSAPEPPEEAPDEGQ